MSHWQIKEPGKEKLANRRRSDSQLCSSERAELEYLRKRQQARSRRGSRVDAIRRDSYNWNGSFWLGSANRGDSSGHSGSDSDGHNYSCSPQQHHQQWLSTSPKKSSNLLSTSCPPPTGGFMPFGGRAGSCKALGSDGFDLAPNGGAGFGPM